MFVRKAAPAARGAWAVWWASAVCCVHGVNCLFKSPLAEASGGFLLTTSPNRGGQNYKTFLKKIRPPRSGVWRFFFKNPQGLVLAICPASLEICWQKAHGEQVQA